MSLHPRGCQMVAGCTVMTALSTLSRLMSIRQLSGLGAMMQHWWLEWLKFTIEFVGYGHSGHTVWRMLTLFAVRARCRCHLHPNIVALKEVFLTKAHLAVVMEFVKGANMPTFLVQHAPLPENDARCGPPSLLLLSFRLRRSRARDG